MAGETSLGCVLVVEDDAAFSALLSDHLRRQHIDVVRAETGVAAWNLLREGRNRIDLVLSDLRMPRLGGLDLLALLQADGRVPFVLMSAFVDPMVVEAAHALGAIAVLSKPFELDALTELTRSILARHQAVH
jgi:CheY-like chemotaxis protein